MKRRFLIALLGFGTFFGFAIAWSNGTRRRTW